MGRRCGLRRLMLSKSWRDEQVTLPDHPECPPLELVFLQDFQTRGEALECERQVKKWSRKKKEALIEQKWDLLQLSAKKKFT